VLQRDQVVGPLRDPRRGNGISGRNVLDDRLTPGCDLGKAVSSPSVCIFDLVGRTVVSLTHREADDSDNLSMKRTTVVLAIPALVYALSWFVPVYDGGITVGEGGLPGWEAFNFALAPIWSNHGDTIEWLLSVWMALSALTNVWFLVALAILVLWPHRTKRGVFWGLVFAALLNTLWLLFFGDDLDELRMGYYLWLSSYLLLAAAARLIAVRITQSTSRLAAV
jgi:hypothetical protein